MSTSMSDLAQGVDVFCAAAHALLPEPSYAGGNRVSQLLDAARALMKLLRKFDGRQSCGLQFKVSLIEASEAVLLKMPVARPQEQDPDFSGEDKFQAMKALARRTQNLQATMTSNVGKNSVTLDSRIAEWTTTIVENAFTIVKDYGSSLVQDTVRSAQEPLTTMKTKSSGCQGESVWYDETTDETSWEEYNDLAQRTLLVQDLDHVDKTCVLAVLEFEGRRRDVTQTFRIVYDFATELQGAIRGCQVFRFEFDLMRSYNGNCPKAALMKEGKATNAQGGRREKKQTHKEGGGKRTKRTRREEGKEPNAQGGRREKNQTHKEGGGKRTKRTRREEGKEPNAQGGRREKNQTHKEGGGKRNRRTRREEGN